MPLVATAITWVVVYVGWRIAFRDRRELHRVEQALAIKDMIVVRGPGRPGMPDLVGVELREGAPYIERTVEGLVERPARKWAWVVATVVAIGVAFVLSRGG